MREQTDIQTKLGDWLLKNGYPLEMKVAGALRRGGFNVTQGSYYTDPESKDSREIDVVATRGDRYGYASFTLVVECKSSRKNPWVVFSDETASTPLIDLAFHSNTAWRKIVDDVGEGHEWHRGHVWARRLRGSGYGVATAFAKDDMSFKATMGVLKASVYTHRAVVKKDSFTKYTYVFPVVVVDTRLFEAYLDASTSEVALREVDDAFVSSIRSIDGQRCCAVHIVTASHLAEFVDEAKEMFDRLIGDRAEEFDTAWAQIRVEQERVVSGLPPEPARPDQRQG